MGLALFGFPRDLKERLSENLRMGCVGEAVAVSLGCRVASGRRKQQHFSGRGGFKLRKLNGFSRRRRRWGVHVVRFPNLFGTFMSVGEPD